VGLRIAAVLLDDDVPASVEEITRDVEARWKDLPYATAAEGDGQTLSFNLGSATVAVGRMPAPYPWSDLEGPCSTSLFWPSATEQLKPLRYHWIVTVTDDARPVELAFLTTRVTASVLATRSSAVGVYWLGPLVVPRDLWLSLAEAMTPRDPPIEMWVDFRVGWDGRKTSSGFTQGMRALGHMELEIREAPESPAELRERLVAVARYVVTGAGRIRDGDTIGSDARERIRIAYAESLFGHRDEVMRLEFEQRSRWKLW
jgi:hypothetical protein